jgi:transketolase
MMKKEVKNIDKKIIDNIKALAIDMIDLAGSGHPGIVLGSAPIYIHYMQGI